LYEITIGKNNTIEIPIGFNIIKAAMANKNRQIIINPNATL